MIQYDQFTPQIRDYLNSLPPWQDTTVGWVVPDFYDAIINLRSCAQSEGEEEKEEYTDAADKFWHIFYQYNTHKLARAPFEDVLALGKVITDLYNWWKEHGRIDEISDSIILQFINDHSNEILPGSDDYIDLDDIIL